MLPFPVVEDFDVLEAGGFHVGMSGVANPMHPLIFEAVEPTLRRRVSQQFPFRLIEQVMPNALSLS